MAEPGLTSRLRQHSRRAGMLVGLSMAITIVICIVAFIWIYLRVGPYLSDFIPADTADTPVSGLGLIATPTETSLIATPAAAPGLGGAAVATPTPQPSPTPVWEATHRIKDGPQINFRAGPSTLTDVLAVLPSDTQLKFLGQQQEAGGATWMRFQTRDGTQGWVRSIDVTPITP